MAPAPKPHFIPSPEACVEAVLEKVGKKVVLGLPLGLGKANHFANALFKRAKADQTITLTIFASLSLERPRPGSELERRFVEPLSDRLFADYTDLDYVAASRTNSLPANIKVHEFFLTPGQWLGVESAQRDYVSMNYTHAARDLMAMGANVIGQMIAKRGTGRHAHYSLSCNTDVTLDLMDMLEAQSDRPFALVGEVNNNLPFMPNDAEKPADYFDFIIDDPALDACLFSTPKPAVALADYAAGFHAASLVRDGGTLQIGIGAMSDAITYALILRQKHNDIYHDLLDRLGDSGAECAKRETKPFKHGLYGASEMMVDGFLHLVDAGVLKRKVYPDLALQQLLNDGKITERVTKNTLGVFVQEGLITSPLDGPQVKKLKAWGVLDDDVSFKGGRLIAPDGAKLTPNITADAALQKIVQNCLGTKLKGGILLHGGFFLGPRDFYAKLRALPEDQLNAINMTAISYINELYGDEALKTAQRRDARFINTAMMVSLFGAVTSDGLASGRVVSGVGGQYNFVAQAHALKDARSIILVRATREKAGKTKSNIVFSYGHTTIPRHLRDIFATEYGIADLRGRSDRDCAIAMLNITDSRFQDELLAKAKGADKIEASYQIPKRFRNNLPEHLGAHFAQAKAKGLFPAFPLGTDLTLEEIRLGRALRWLQAQSATRLGQLKLGAGTLFNGGAQTSYNDLLERMALAQPKGVQEHLLARLVVHALKSTE